MTYANAVLVLENRRRQCLRIADAQVGMTGSIEVRSFALTIETNMRVEAEAIAITLDRLRVLEAVR